jgi:hypothetical protein
MNFVLGIYNKTEKNIDYLIKKSLNDFLLNNTRNYYQYHSQNFRLFLYPKYANVNDNIFENDGTIWAIAGYSTEKIPVKHPFGKINGKYQLIEYNKEEKKIIVQNDADGHFPMYYINNNNIFAFCNEYEPLLKLLPLPQLDKTSIAHYFYFGATSQNSTFIKQIKLLPPKVTIRCIYENINFVKNDYILPNKKIYYNEILNSFPSILKKTIKSYFDICDNPTFSLTGGVDTRIIAGCIPEQFKSKSRFFTLNEPNISDSDNNEILISAMIAKQLGIPHDILSNKLFPYPSVFNKQYFYDIRKSFPADFPCLGMYGSEFFKAEFIAIVPKIIYNYFCDNYKLNVNYSWIYDQQTDSKKNKKKRINNLNLKKILLKNFTSDVDWDTLNKQSKYLHNISYSEAIAYSLDFITRSFFTNVYRGSRSGWVQPEMFFKNAYMPFTAHEIIMLFKNIPIEKLSFTKNNFYNEIYKNNFHELLNIPTNSLVGKTQGTCFNFYDKHKNPLSFWKNNDDELILNLLKDEEIYDMNFFNIKKLKKLINDNRIHDFFIDFCVWYKYFNSIR